MNATQERLMTPPEAAEILGTTEGTLRVWRCTKRYPLPYVRLGRAIRYRESDVLNFITSRTVTPQTPNI